MNAHRIVVLGAGYAGLGAAKRLARRLTGHQARVSLVNLSDRFVERVRLHQLATGQALRDLPLRELAGPDVDLVVARVTAIDLAARTVHLDTAPHTLGYDTLVYAIGSSADVDAVPGIRDHAFTVADAGAARRLRTGVAAFAPGTKVAVVGGGLTGIETAAELAESRPDLRIDLFSDRPVGDWLSPRARRHLERSFGRMGVTVHEGVPVAEVTAGGLRLAGGQEHAAEAVVWAAGFRVPALAREAGLAVDTRGRMLVDATLRSLSHPEVYGVGDAAAAAAPGGVETRMSCQTGLPMGAHVADVIARRFVGAEPAEWRMRYVCQNISLGRRDGVTQFTRGDDSPTGTVLTGRLAALFKEMVTRGTVLALRNSGRVRPIGWARGHGGLRAAPGAPVRDGLPDHR